MNHDLFQYVLRQADNCMVLCQRLCALGAQGPELEEDIALSNMSLDLLGQARALYNYASTLEGKGRSEDDFAFMRDERNWYNVHLVEQPNGDFGDVIARQFVFDAWHINYLKQLQTSTDSTLAAIAAKAIKEVTYHLRHSSQWVIRLGDGTDESHRRMQRAINHIWRFTPELFMADELDQRMQAQGIGVDLAPVHMEWDNIINSVLSEATLTRPPEEHPAQGGREGIHSEYMGYLLAEMQSLPRAMPGCQW